MHTVLKQDVNRKAAIASAAARLRFACSLDLVSLAMPYRATIALAVPGTCAPDSRMRSGCPSQLGGYARDQGLH